MSEPTIPPHLPAPDAAERADVARSVVGLFPLQPGAVKATLESLLDDPSAAVRTAVADALDVIAHRNPIVALDWAEEWAGPAPSDVRVQLLRHGLRSLRTAGNARAFRVTDHVDYQR